MGGPDIINSKLNLTKARNFPRVYLKHSSHSIGDIEYFENLSKRNIYKICRVEEKI